MCVTEPGVQQQSDSSESNNAEDNTSAIALETKLPGTMNEPDRMGFGVVDGSELTAIASTKKDTDVKPTLQCKPSSPPKRLSGPQK